jgi:poly-gamma-glutamate capsule biosynthesis protein CapA/YwtB (metallophosphatase superfamily)
MGVEVIRNKLVLYGCGDFLNDYEGIGGHEQYRPELALMYFPELDRASGELRRLLLVPLRLRGLRLERADPAGAEWLLQTLRREGRQLGTSVAMDGSGTFSLAWQ